MYYQSKLEHIMLMLENLRDFTKDLGFLVDDINDDLSFDLLASSSKLDYILRDLDKYFI